MLISILSNLYFYFHINLDPFYRKPEVLNQIFHKKNFTKFLHRTLLHQFNRGSSSSQ